METHTLWAFLGKHQVLRYPNTSILKPIFDVRVEHVLLWFFVTFYPGFFTQRCEILQLCMVVSLPGRLSSRYCRELYRCGAGLIPRSCSQAPKRIPDVSGLPIPDRLQRSGRKGTAVCLPSFLGLHHRFSGQHWLHSQRSATAAQRQ